MSRLKISFYGGVREVGGNKILLRLSQQKESVFLDFGKQFEAYAKYYSPPQHYPRELDELIQLGLTPNIPGLYSTQLDAPSNLDPDKDPEAPIDAVIISHAHLDHIGFIGLLSRKIPIYMGECTAHIFEGIRKTAWGLPIDSRYQGLESSVKTFTTGDKIRIGDIIIEPIHVDHSVPGSYGFLIETPYSNIVYTGDLRLHGNPSLTLDFLERAKMFEPDVLIIESTHIDFSGYTSEHEVELKVSELLRRSGISKFLAGFSKVDYDRLFSIFTACRNNDFTLVIDLKRFILLRHILLCQNLRKRILLDTPRLKIILTKMRYSPYEREAIKELLERHPDRIIVPTKLIPKIHKILDQHKASHDLPEKAIIAPVFVTPQILKLIGLKRAVYLLASSEPLDEESEIQFERLKNWLELYGIPIYHIHASGHATPIDLKRIIEYINPKTVIPIHGKHPELLINFVGKSRFKWLLPQPNTGYTLA